MKIYKLSECVLIALFIPSICSAIPGTEKYTVELKPSSASKVMGIVTFEKTKDGILIKGDLKNLKPGQHGIHVHEKGDCSAPDAMSAGNHFNPENSVHGSPVDAHKHTGDFGNITASQEGEAKFEFVNTDIQFNGEKSILGKALVVHAEPDDLKSQPSGDSGERVACGVIG